MKGKCEKLTHAYLTLLTENLRLLDQNKTVYAFGAHSAATLLFDT